MGVERQDAPDRPALAVVVERLAGDGDRLGPVGRPRGHGEHQDLGPRAEEGAECRPGGRGRCRARGRRSRGSGRGGGSRPAVRISPKWWSRPNWLSAWRATRPQEQVALDLAGAARSASRNCRGQAVATGRTSGRPTIFRIEVEHRHRRSVDRTGGQRSAARRPRTAPMQPVATERSSDARGERRAIAGSPRPDERSAWRRDRLGDRPFGRRGARASGRRGAYRRRNVGDPLGVGLGLDLAAAVVLGPGDDPEFLGLAGLGRRGAGRSRGRCRRPSRRGSSARGAGRAGRRPVSTSGNRQFEPPLGPDPAGPAQRTRRPRAACASRSSGLPT